MTQQLATETIRTGGGRLDHEKMRRISFASVVGTTVEWYDLFLYGTASALVFGQVFFANVPPALGTFFAFLTFAAAYVARIIGAVLFGHFGDRIGRKSMLLVSLITMGVATFGIGLIPGYDTLGALAPLLLLTLRVIQGLALGGEWGGAVLMVVEHAPREKRGWFGSLVQIGVPFGTALANAAFLIVTFAVDKEALHAWGWRIPFLASVILIAVGIYIRLNIEETPSFKMVQREGAKAKLPFAYLMRHYWVQVLLGGVATLSTGSTFTLLVTAGVNYGTNDLHFTENTMLVAVLISCIVGLFGIPFFGWLSDRVSRRAIILGGIIGEIALAFPFFMMLNTREVALLVLAYSLMMLVFCANYGPIATFLAELFGSKVRYSGLSVAYMLSGLLGSAITPAITVWLHNLTGQSSSIAWYIMGSAALSLCAVVLLRGREVESLDTTGDTPHSQSLAGAGA